MNNGALMRWILFGKWCNRNHIPYMPKIVNKLNRVIFAADIPCSTIIGSNTTFVHNGLGVVVNPEAVIGNNVRIYQNVSITGRGQHGVPIIEDDVHIYAHALVMGGVRIGKGARIGAGAIVLQDVPERAIVVGNPAKVIKYSEDI